MKAKIDLEKFICSYVKWNNIHDALKDQGLKCCNGEIVEIPQESEDERIKKEILELISISGNGNQFEEIKDWLEKQGEQKEYTFKSLPRLLDMIEPTSKAKAYCQKLIDTLVKEGYVTDAKIVEECLKKINGEKVALATMDNQKINKSEDERIKGAIIDHLKDNNLTEWAAWLEKQGKQKPKKVSIWKHWKDGIAGGSEHEQIFLTKVGSIYSISSCLGCECDYIELSELDKLMREEGKPKWTEEDDYNVKCCIAKAEFDIANGCLGRNKEIIEWLKSLKERMEK